MDGFVSELRRAMQRVTHIFSVASTVTFALPPRPRASICQLLRTWVPTLIAWTLVTASTPLIGRQPTAQQTYRERVNVPRLVIDARVMDKSGDAVSDLTPNDFDVEIDGKPSRIDSLEYVPFAQTTDQRAPRPSTPAQPGRTIVFLYQKKLDLTQVAGLMRVHRDLAAFVDVLRPSDRAAVISFDTRLHIWTDFTADRDRVRHILEHDIISGSPSRGLPQSSDSVLARISEDAQRKSDSIEKALQVLGESLEPLPGPKTIVVLGYAMGTWIPRLGTVDLGRSYTDALQALHSARASVFCIDLTAADYHPREEGLRLLADDTGGFYEQSHIFTTAIFNRLASALAGYYALLVVPPDDQKDGEHHIDVRLLHRGGTVLAKRRYVQQ